MTDLERIYLKTMSKPETSMRLPTSAGLRMERRGWVEWVTPTQSYRITPAGRKALEESK